MCILVGGLYYFPFLFNLWIIMLEYLSINQCQCCEVVVVVFIYSHPAYRVCWHKAFIYLYGCIWLVEYHTQRKRKTYTTSVNQWIKLMRECERHRIAGDTADPWCPVEQSCLLPAIMFLEIRISFRILDRNTRPCRVTRASLAKSCLIIVLFFIQFCPAHLHLLCVVLTRYINWVLLRTAFWRKERLWSIDRLSFQNERVVELSETGNSLEECFSLPEDIQCNNRYVSYLKCSKITSVHVETIGVCCLLFQLIFRFMPWCF